MFVMSYFSWFLREFVSGKWEIVDKGWIGCIWIKRVPEDESTPTFNAVFHFFKTVPAYQEVDTHGWMFVSFEQIHVFPTFDTFSFFLVVIFQWLIHWCFTFFSTISLIQFFSCFVVRVGMAVVWAYTKGITMKKTTSCWHPFLFRVFSSSQSFCFYGVVFIFWEKRFIKGTFSSRYSIKTYEMMVRFLSPIFLYDQMCLNTFLLQMNWLYMIHQLIKKNN